MGVLLAGLAALYNFYNKIKYTTFPKLNLNKIDQVTFSEIKAKKLERQSDFFILVSLNIIYYSIMLQKLKMTSEPVLHHTT